MAVYECAECGDETDEAVRMKVGRKTVKLCEDCADRIREEREIAGEAESAMQSMMEYKGR
ncbi:MAG: hypothetical protein RMA76_24810 [Deltaproteobacteria bacterium]|jgi:NAD-dependent SIR2 family protein deacetylase